MLCVVVVMLSPVYVQGSNPKSPAANEAARNTADDGPKDSNYNPQSVTSAFLQSNRKDGPAETRDQHSPVKSEDISITLAREDLNAQQTMADSAQRTVSIGWWQLIVGIVGIVGLLVTLGYTIRATKAAEKAAEAATAALTSDRAWIVYSGANIKPRNIGEPIRYTVKFTNSGKTPGLNVMARHVVKIGRPDEDIGAFARVQETTHQSEPPENIIPLGYDQTCASPIATGNISQEMTNRITAGDAVVYVFGIINYDDVFGAHHVTRYCYAFDRSCHELNPCGKYNEMT
jgi:hypothetical protein